MTDSGNNDLQPLARVGGADRLAKLRALGREMELRARFDVLKQESASKEQHYLQEIERAKGETQSALAERDAVAAERDAITAQLEHERRNAAEREQELAAQLENSRLQLQMVLNSTSWKITQPLRTVKGWLGSQPQPAPPAPAKDVSPEPSEVPPAPAPEVPRTEETQGAAEISVTPEVGVREASEPAAAEPACAPAPRENFLTGGKEAWDEAGSRRLREFLASPERLAFPTPAPPAFSIVIALYNKAHLAILCLDSILRHAGGDYELVLVDNNSTDETGRLLDRIEGAKIIRNRENTGFGHACVQGAQAAAGKYLCFLNSDLILCPGGVDAAIGDLERDPKLGAIGGKLRLADGRLQEAGSMVWRDGTAWGYGREDDPASPKYAFRRPVDYCSGALLLTPRALFLELGGFDERFSPAYYEDTDYCFQVWERGLQVLYEPELVVHHYESASMDTPGAAAALIADHRAKFVDKWRARLDRQLPLSGAAIPYARIAARAGGARIVYMSARVPHRDGDAHSANANDFLRQLRAAGHSVTCVSTAEPLQAGDYRDLPKEVELADAKTQTHYVFRELLSQYDAAWIAGADSMREFLWHLWKMDERIPPIIYEPGSLPESEDGENRQQLEEEITFAQAADLVMVRSQSEREMLVRNRAARVQVLTPEFREKVLAEVAGRGAHL